MITKTRLMELLTYNQKNGNFTWNVKANFSRVIGSIAGGINDQGYWRIYLDGKSYKAHRLAWLYVYGNHPKEIDHINRIKLDNRIENLREVSHIYNMHNQFEAQKNSKTGLRGVIFIRNKYYAQIQINKKKISLGYFTSFEDACDAYAQAKIIYQPEAR